MSGLGCIFWITVSGFLLGIVDWWARRGLANAASRHRAFVASRSSPQAVLTKGFNRISQGDA